MIPEEHVILLVEDNPDDVELTRRAFSKCNILNTMVVASDGEEALDYLFQQGKHADRDTALMPHMVRHLFLRREAAGFQDAKFQPPTRPGMKPK
ncbi:MAG: hypothetical protein ABI824_05105 [Acidobacteriota bacterium]